MKGFKARVIKEMKLSLDDLYIQYVPGRFFREVFPGDEKTMLSIVSSPHYRFLQLYIEVGEGIWEHYDDTDYIHLMEFWGRKDKYNRKKVTNFVKTYNSIKANGLKNPIVVSQTPIYKKFFDDGYEIYHGHHRAAICKILGYKKVECRIVKVKKRK